MDDPSPKVATSKKKRTKAVKSIFANVQNTKYITVRRCMKEIGFKFTESTNKNLLFWCDNEGTIEFTQRLQRWQFYNHFPGMLCIAHKVDLVRLYNKMVRRAPDLYNFHPKTFIIPIELPQLQSYMQSFSKKTDRTVIVKPDRGSQGKGIIIVQDFDDLDDFDDSGVAQYYIPPLLINNKKFDMRIYVLVTSCDPLRVYIFDEGMMRFCTEDYQKPKASNLDEAFAHLTNFSLNKKNAAFDFHENKKYKTDVFQQLKELGYDTNKIQREIDRIIMLTMIAAQPTLASNYHIAVNANDGKSRCFEILGFDIILDSNAKPWLLEVNCMPSLASYSEFDANLKSRVITGALKIIDLQPNFKYRCMQRFKAMSTKRNRNFKPFFSPEKETEIAKTTEWRQLIPVLNDPEFDEMVNKAMCASSDGPFIRKTPLLKADDNPRTSQKSERKINENERSQTSKENRPKIARSISKSIDSTQKDRVIVQPNKLASNNIHNQDEGKLAPKKNPSLTRPQASPKVVSQPRTPRSVILANEARLNRMNALDRRMQYHDPPPIYVLFTVSKNDINPISESEERERIRAIKQQVILANSMKMLAAIKTVIKDGKAADFSDIQGRHILPDKKQQSKVGKRQIIRIQTNGSPLTGIPSKRLTFEPFVKMQNAESWI